MKFNDKAEVYAADGKKLGHLGRVVLNPNTWEVTDIVVHSGYFFTTDKVIPVGDMQQTLEDRVTLHENATVDAYPDYLDTEFLPLVGDSKVASELPSPVLWYPPFGMMVYNPMISMDPHVVHKTENIPAGSQALAVGSEVITSDGKRVGHVQEVFVESTTNFASHILISKGLLLPGEKLIPTPWISEIDANEIHLSVGADMMMSLPDYNRQG